MRQAGKWIAVLTVAFVLAGQAQAILVNAVGDPNGNGLINGSAVPIDLNPTNIDVGLSKDYTSTGDMFIQIATSGPTVFTLQEDIVNNTGIDWTDFHWEILDVQGGPVRFLGINGTGPFTETVMDNAIWLDGGVLPSGGVLVSDLTIETDVSAVFTIRQFPTFDTGVPEPVSAAMGMMGLAVLGYATRRRTV